MGDVKKGFFLLLDTELDIGKKRERESKVN